MTRVALRPSLTAACLVRTADLGRGETLAFNANLGADRDATGARTSRFGASSEWTAHNRLTLIAERVKLGGDWTSRLGARFGLTSASSVDFSSARVGPSAARVFVIGLNHDFDR